MTPLPEPPENVRVVFDDGREIPLEMVYVGREPCGCHLWDAVIPFRIAREGSFKILADMLPADTSIGVHVEMPAGMRIDDVTASANLDPPPWLRPDMEPPPPWRRAPGDARDR